MWPGAFGSIERRLLQSAAQAHVYSYIHIHTPVKSRWLRCSQFSQWPRCCWAALPPPWPGTSWTSTWRGRTWTRSCTTSPPSLPNHSSSEGSSIHVTYLILTITLFLFVFGDFGWHRHGQNWYCVAHVSCDCFLGESTFNISTWIIHLIFISCSNIGRMSQKKMTPLWQNFFQMSRIWRTLFIIS